MLFSLSCYGQVGPAEITDPLLKAAEQTYLPQMLEVNREVARIKFPFSLVLSRYAGLSPKEQIGADTRGLEFVRFHERLVLKVTANYNAAYNTNLLTPNQRAGQVFLDVIVPILRLLPAHFTSRDQFEAIGFEIAYHIRTHRQRYEYEGKEILVLVTDKSDALNSGNVQDMARQQEFLNHSEIYLDGKPIGLALGIQDPYDAEALAQTVRKQTLPATVVDKAAPTGAQQHSDPPVVVPRVAPEKTVAPSDPPAALTRAAPEKAVAPSLPDLDMLQKKYQAKIDDLTAEGLARHHFVDYSPPSFIVFRGQIAMQLTLKNPTEFEQDRSSIYKRAAQSFDLFFAPQLKPILDRVPEAQELSALDVTIINELTAKSGKSSEALEFVFPLHVLRRFMALEVTNQELIDQSIVLVNGVRIALNLQLVE